MGAPNNYLEGWIPNFYRREVMHIMIFTFIDTYKFLYPTVTIQEAADAFMKRFKVLDQQYSRETVVAIYGRVNQDLIDAERFKNNQQRPQA